MLSNPERRKHYDKYGTVMDDDESEEAFFKDFESMFMGGDFYADIDSFSEYLESDTKMFRKIFRDLGRNMRLPGVKRSKQSKKGGKNIDDGNVEEMISMFMMPGMMGMGLNLGGK